MGAIPCLRGLSFNIGDSERGESMKFVISALFEAAKALMGAGRSL